MTTPPPQGSGFALGAYRIRVLWLRVAFSAFLALWLIGLCSVQPSDPPKGPDLDAPTPPAPLPLLEDRLGPRDRAARAALKRPIDLDFDEAPLEDVLDTIRALTELNFVYDSEVRGLIEDPKHKVRIKARGIPAERALRLVLEPDLGFRIRHGLVLIGVGPSAPDLFTEYYDLRDLIDGRLRDRGGAALNIEPLYELVERVLGPTAQLSDIAFAEHILTLRTDFEGHRAVCALIRRLRGAPGRLPQRPAWIRSLEQKLEEPLDFRSRSASLSELLGVISEKVGVPVRLDPTVFLEDLRLDLRLKRVPARVLLRVALEQLAQEDIGLTTSFRDGALLVHHRGDRRSDYALRVIDIRDIIPEDPAETDEDGGCLVIEEEPSGEPESVLDPEQLIETLRVETGEFDWDDPADIRVHRGQLIVWQTAAMHRAIDRALARMRRVDWLLR